jgi:hypothetical protein
VCLPTMGTFNWDLLCTNSVLVSMMGNVEYENVEIMRTYWMDVG